MDEIKGWFFTFRGNGYAGYDTLEDAHKKFHDLNVRAHHLYGYTHLRLDNPLYRHEFAYGTVFVKDRQLVDYKLESE